MPDDNQTDRPQKDDKAIMQAPSDEGTNHGTSLDIGSTARGMTGENTQTRASDVRAEAQGGAELRIVQISGAEGDRTLNLRIANAALSQLSYRPSQLDLLKYRRCAERKV